MGMMTRRNMKAREAKASLPVREMRKEEPIAKEEPQNKEEVNLSTMPYFGLKSLAKKHGIDATGKSTAELRDLLSEVI